MNLKSLSTLQIALGASFAVHAVLLTVRFVDPESFNRVFRDTPLEVVLVNARSNERPDKAQAIAQSSLAGGGEAEKGRATSPLPPSALTEMGDAAEDAQRKIETMQEQQMVLLAQLKKQPRFCFDTETTGTDERTAELVGLAVAEVGWP